MPPVSLAAGLAVRDALANVLSPRVLLKWPNDVVVSRPDGTFAKLAGILVESALSGSRVEHVVVGIGINVHTRTFPDAVAGLASSVALEGAAAPDRASILVDVLAGLDRDVENVAHRGLALVHGRIEAHDALLGREVESDDGALRGTAAGIDPEGRLIVRRDEGTLVRVSSGEVRVRLR